jgi:RNA polymerase sigma-70 factor (ECF subfamily)
MINMMTEVEQELTRAACNGNRQALGELTRRLYKPVCALASRLLPRPDQSADIAQETFARVAAHISTFDSAKRFSAWVFTIAANLCRDRCRRDKSLRFLDSVEETDVSIEAPPEANAIQRENGERVCRALQELPFDLKAVVVLHFQHDLPVNEIADSLGITVNAVRIRLFRALEGLRQTVKE